MKKLLIVLALLIAVSNASATFDWYGIGKTTAPAGVSRDWFVAANWNSGVPNITAATGVRMYGDTAYYNTSIATGCVIATGNARAVEVRVGSSGPGEVTAARLIINSGTLKTSNFLMIAPDSPGPANNGRAGEVIMTGGTVTLGGATADGLDNGGRTNGHLFVGHGTGTIQPYAKLTMSGGLIDAGGDFAIGKNRTHGSAYLSGNAVIKANTLKMIPDSTLATAYLEISGNAKVIINGDCTANVALWRSYGWINEDVQTSLTMNPGKTTLFVPEPATICILVIGTLGLIRRK